MAFPTTVLASESSSFSESIECIISQRKSCLLIICSDREEFLVNFSVEGSASWAAHPPTVRQIASSKNIRVAFTPTLMHLRAYIAALPYRKESLEGTENIKILDLLQIHRSTSEFSAQGISRTLALILESVVQLRLPLQLIEISRSEISMDIQNRHSSIFSERVPVLNGSLQPLVGDRVWAGRTVETGSIFAEWLKVER